MLLDGTNVVSEGDLFAAFVDGELRGVGSLSEVPDVPPVFGEWAGENQFAMLVYSNEGSGEDISFKFYDQGKGIDLKDSEKIFDRFYSDRQDNIKNHTGLGLSIAREIITHMNGQISLDKSDKSEYPGACFLIILPVRHTA